MTFNKRRAFHIGGASWLLLCAVGNGAMAQDAAAPSASTQLPEITVTAPSPIVRRNVAPARTPARVARGVPGRNRERENEPQPAPVAAAPQQGVLPVVTDQFATVTVVPNEEIRRQGGGTLGDLLFSKPGITGSSFAPGASSRPIIRGLDVNRVGIVENGIGSNGASDLGEDHFVPIDPLSTNQIEVIRGPATLRYGSTAIGGVVSATNNRIPDALPTCAAPAVSDLRASGEGAARQCRIAGMHERRDPHRGQFGRSRRRRRHSARRRRRQFCHSCRRVWTKVGRLQHPELSLSVRPDPAGQRTPAEFRGAGRRRIDRRFVFLPWRLHRRGRSRRTIRSITSPASTAPITRRGSTRVKPNSRPRANTGRTRRRSMRCASGRAPPTTSTTRSASPTPPT